MTEDRRKGEDEDLTVEEGLRDLRLAVAVFVENTELVYDAEAQHELKHKALNRIFALEALITLAAERSAACASDCPIASLLASMAENIEERRAEKEGQ